MGNLLVMRNFFVMGNLLVTRNLLVMRLLVVLSSFEKPVAFAHADSASENQQ
jgi:hypothetical protein